MIMPSLNGKTALVTGASRGMGRASALALAAAGAQVLVHYGRGAKEADGVVAEIRKGGGRADAVAADLATADGPHKLAKLTRDIVGDRLDVLVANAGISKAATIEDTTIEDFDKLFAVNVRAPFFLVQQLLPIMSKGSSIIFVSSLAVSSKPTCRTSPRRTPAGTSRWACRRSSAWRSPTTSVALSPSWHLKTRGGSRAIPSTSMAAQSSELKQHPGKQ